VYPVAFPGSRSVHQVLPVRIRGAHPTTMERT
jgi:hypothetical protein